MRESLGCDRFVYFMHREDQPWTKIGISNNPHRRREEVQKDIGCKVTLFSMLMIPDRCFDNAYQLEQWIHKKFSSLRVDGEWFKSMSAELIALNVVRSEKGYFIPSYYYDTRDASIVHTKPEDISDMYLAAKYANIRYLKPQTNPENGVHYTPKINTATFKLIKDYVLTNFEEYGDILRKVRYV